MDWETIRAEMAKVIGRPPESIPLPHTPEFYALMTELEQRDATLYQAVTEALVGGIEPPAATRKELSREARRAEVRRRLLRPFVKQDPTQPRRYRANRTSIMVVVAVGLVALLWIFQMRASHSPARATRSSLLSAVLARPSPPSAAAPMPATPPTSSPLAAPPLPLPPTPPAALSVVPPMLPPGPRSTPGASNGTVVTIATPEKAAGIQIVAPAREEARLTVVSPSSAQAAEAPGRPSGSQGGTVVLNGPPALGTGPSTSAQAAAPVRLQIGDQFTVALTTPLAVSNGWRSIPALAVARDGPLAGWKIVGQASLAQDGTTQISWVQALSPDGRISMPIHGVAYNPKNGIPGVAGVKTVPMAPQAARTVLSGSLAAVGQYVNAQLVAQQVAVSGITATLTTQVPPFWQFVASELATGFQPAPVQTGGIVLVSQMPAGLPITVFITAPSQSHAGVARPAGRERA
jgi:hypothetical protein